MIQGQTIFRRCKMELKMITVEMVREWEPCYDPTEIVPEDWTGTVLDVLDLDISIDDKFWVVLRDELLPERLLREFARWCALQVIHLWNAPDVVREYLETGNEELRAAARAVAGAAAWDAARDVARAVAGDAAGAAAWDAAWDAARAVARDVARDAQENKLRELINDERHDHNHGFKRT
jgi:hypothetical protein